MANRTHPREIDPLAGAVGDVLKVGANGSFEVGPVPGGPGGAAALDDLTDVDTATTPPTDGQVLKWSASSSLWVPGADATGTSGGGGGSSANGPDGKPTVNTPPSSPNPKDDEFNDASGSSGPTNGLDAKWSKRNMGTAGWSVLDDTKAPGCFMFDIPSGQPSQQVIQQPAPSGDFRVTARAILGEASDRQFWGLIIADATWATGLMLALDDPGGDATTYMRDFSGGFTAVSSRHNSVWVAGTPLYMSLRKSGTTYYASIWTADRLLPGIPTEVARAGVTFTPAFVGFGRNLLGAGSAKVLLDWLRIS